MLKSWNEMAKIDISKYVEQRDKADYLPWAVCLKLLYENGAEKVAFEPVINEKDGTTLFRTEEKFGKEKEGRFNQCYEVRVKITIDDLQFVQNYPLINGTIPITTETLTSLRVASAQARAFVKGVAIRTGLGISLWTKDEGDEEPIITVESAYKGIDSAKKFAQELYTEKLKKLGSLDEVAKAMGTTLELFKAEGANFDRAKEFINKLNKV